VISMMLSRSFVAAHFPSQTVAGALYGLLCVFCCRPICEEAIRWATTRLNDTDRVNDSDNKIKSSLQVIKSRSKSPARNSKRGKSPGTESNPKKVVTPKASSQLTSFGLLVDGCPGYHCLNRVVASCTQVPCSLWIAGVFSPLVFYAAQLTAVTYYNSGNSNSYSKSKSFYESALFALQGCERPGEVLINSLQHGPLWEMCGISLYFLYCILNRARPRTVTFPTTPSHTNFRVADAARVCFSTEALFNLFFGPSNNLNINNKAGSSSKSYSNSYNHYHSGLLALGVRVGIYMAQVATVKALLLDTLGMDKASFKMVISFLAMKILD